MPQYEVVAHSRAGEERIHRYAQDEPLEPGQVLRLDGRFWLVERVEDVHARARPARYRVTVRHPGGREEHGAFRRYRVGAPGVGHSFATIEDGRPASWEVVAEQLAYDEEGAPYLDLVAERDFAERDEVPDHELEHALARRSRRLSE